MIRYKMIGINLDSLLGIFLFFFPFFSLFFVPEKKKYFLFLVFLLISFYSFFSFFLQFFKIFYRSHLLFLAILFDLFFFIFFLKKRKGKRIILPDLKEFFFFSLLIFISFLTLYQVHWNYTGKINLATDFSPVYHEVKNMKYPYPYFSDEWFAVLLIKESIKNHSLPLWDPLNQTPFLNFELLFHSFLSGLFLLFNFSPLNFYVVFSLFFNLLIILIIYLFFRINNFSFFSSLLFSLFTLYLTCGANLPGIWHFIPIHLGIIFFLLALCFSSFQDSLKTFLSFIFAFLFYPPLFIFSFLGGIIFFFKKFRLKKDWFSSKKRFLLFTIFLLFVFIFLFFLFLKWQKIILSKIFFESSYGSHWTPNINPFYIIPFPVIVFALLGLPYIFRKNKILFFSFLLGGLFWFFYSFSSKRFIIDYERVVFLSSLLSVLISIFGWQKTKDFFERIKKEAKKIFFFGELIFLCFFIVFIPFYTQREDWQKITVLNLISKEEILPKAPANQYLSANDLIIFQNIKGKKILTLPWKGTVLAAATENIPLLVKEGMMAKGTPNFLKDFLESDCNIKEKMIKQLKIDYLYLNQEISCKNIKKIKETKEGLILYQTLKSK